MSENPGSPSEHAPKIPRATDIEANHVVCPQCGTANRLSNSQCVHCDQDITMLRVLTNKARHHFNSALEHAERQRWEEAVGDLRHALEIDENFVAAWNVLGTCLAKLERFDEARAAWERSINIDPRFAKAHEYLGKVEEVGLARESRRQADALRAQLRRTRVLWVGTAVVLLALLGIPLLTTSGDTPMIDPGADVLQRATTAYAEDNWDGALEALRALARRGASPVIMTAGSTLTTLIESELERLERAMVSAAARGDWRDGLAASSRLLAVNPPPPQREAALQSQALFAGRLIEELRSGLTLLEAGRVTAGELEDAIAGMEPLMPTEALQGELTTIAASVEHVVAAQRREAFHPVWEETLRMRPRMSDVDWLLRVREVAQEWGDQHEVQHALSAAEENLDAEIRTSWQASQGSLRAAEAFRDQMQAVGEATGLPLAAAAAASAEAALPRLRFERDLAALQALAESASAEAQLMALNALDQSQATEEERGFLVALRGDLEERAAQERAVRARALFEELLAEDLAFETLTVDEELARAAIENADLIIEATPDRFYSPGFRRDYALYYAARGAETLGEESLARSLYERHRAEVSRGDHVSKVEAHLARLSEGE